jgi:hypothetical protein
MADALDEKLLAAVRAQFKDLATVEPQVISKLLGTKSIAPWYKDYKERRAIEQALPDEWSEAGLTGAIWAWATGVKQQRAEVRKAHADKTKQLAAEHKQRVDAADRARDAALAAGASPLMDLLEAGYEQLPLAAQAVVSAADDDTARKALLAKALERYRKVKIAELYPEGIDKFIAGRGAAAPTL